MKKYCNVVNILAAVGSVMAIIILFADMYYLNAFQWLFYVGFSNFAQGFSCLLEILCTIAAIILTVLGFVKKDNAKFGLIANGLVLAVTFSFFLQNIITLDIIGWDNNGQVSNVFFLPFIFALGLFIASIILYIKCNSGVEGKFVNAPNSDYGIMYCGIGKYILLSIVTFGIWTFIWTYRVTKFLNKAENCKFQDPASALLLCLFVPFYQIYWYYKQGQKADAFAKSIGLHVGDIGKTCLWGAFFFTPIVPALIQLRINDICVHTVERNI